MGVDGAEWKRKSLVTFALTVLTSSQGILIAWSKKAGGYDYSVTSANFLVELLKCFISVVALVRIWQKDGVNEDNRSERVLQTPLQGWVIAIVMALLSGFAGVYTEFIIKKRPSRNINVQNFWLYFFGIIFNLGAIFSQDSDDIMNKGFFHGYTFITVCMIVNHALSGIAVSMVMKYADNIVKVYSTSVAMLLTALISVVLFGFKLTLPFALGSSVVSIAVFLHSHGKANK